MTVPDKKGDGYNGLFEVFYDKMVCQSNKTMCDPPIIWKNPNEVSEEKSGGGPSAGLIVGIIFAVLIIGGILFLFLWKKNIIGPKVQGDQVNITHNISNTNITSSTNNLNVVNTVGYPQTQMPPMNPLMQGQVPMQG